MKILEIKINHLYLWLHTENRYDNFYFNFFSLIFGEGNRPKSLHFRIFNMYFHFFGEKKETFDSSSSIIIMGAFGCAR
jgi:hypothetical protein